MAGTISNVVLLHHGGCVNIFGGEDASDPVYAKGADFGGFTLAYYSVVTFMFAFVLPFIADKLGRKLTHALCLICGGIGLISVGWVSNKYMLFVCMTWSWHCLGKYSLNAICNA